MITITRKIQLFIDADKDQVTEVWKKLYAWNEVVFRAANYTATHQYIQENIKEFFYLTQDMKVKLADVNKDEAGIFDTSRPNTTYRMLSDKFKGDAPMSMVSAVNNNVVKNFGKERKEYFAGKRSLRSYKRSMPMPIPSQAITHITLTEDEKNYFFTAFGIRFQTFFGKDLSGNKIIWERALKGEYKLCDSSIQLDGKKMFLLAVFQFESERLDLDKEKQATASLSMDVPIRVMIDKRVVDIGSKEEYLHRRMAIQGALRRAQISARYNKAGKGRKKKMQSVERFSKAEYHYVHTRLHQYSRKLVDTCIKYNCGKLVLEGQKEKEKEAKADELLLRNWSYYGLIEMITYKCQKVGIELIVL